MLHRLAAFARSLLLPAALTAPAIAQTAPADTQRVVLPDVRIEAARGAASVATAPFSVAVVAREPAEREADAGASLERALRRVPGLALADRENAALGERLSVRGLGARAAFGVRGVQVVVDGVPLTLPDGQAVLGVVDPALVRRAEIVRGPASALWGNGSGGVLFLSTIPDEAPSRPTAALHTSGGSFGLVRVAADAVAPLGTHVAGAAVSHVRRDGYRAHSAFETTRARAFSDLTWGSARLRLTAALEHAPRLDHPGALTAEEFDTDPRQAQTRYVETASGKASTQAQGAATLRAPTPAGALTATAYALTRDLDNPLPFAYINVDRRAGGVRLAVERAVGPLLVSLGADAAVQRDDRLNRPNESGVPGPAPSLDQTETVLQTAAAARARLDLGRWLPGLALSAALRRDRIRFEADDRLLQDGDQSGARTLGAWSPQVGASYRHGAALYFASWATAFEAPTTTELVNRPDGGGGFNPDLAPQRTWSAEVGTRGVVGALRYDLAAYAMRTRDGLTSSEGDDGRDYFVNRGATRHRGAEAFAEWAPRPALAASVTYTWGRFTFADGAFEGNRLPGLAAHRLSVRLRASRGGLYAAPELAISSGVFADDANSVRAEGAAVLDLTVGHAALPLGRARLHPFVRIENALGARYAGSVALNARGGRYFEPAAGRGVQVGLTAAF